VQLSKLSVKMPIEVANLLNNRKRKDLITLCDNYEVEIDIIGDVKLTDEQIEFFEERRGYAGLRAKTPSLDYWDNNEAPSAPARRSKPGFNLGEGYKKSKSELPLASIGPVPTLIEIDTSEESAVLSAPEKDAEHFSDPIVEALFGLAPKRSLEDILAEIAPQSILSHEAHSHSESLREEALDDAGLDIDSINESLSGIDDIGINEKKPEDGERPAKSRYPSSRRRNYRSRRPHNRSSADKYAQNRVVDTDGKIQSNKNRQDGLGK
jgi:hypothetical protein